MPPRAKPRSFTYEGVVLVVILCWGTAEIGWLGARPSSMTAITGLILSILSKQADKKRRR